MLLQGGLTVGHRAHNPKIGGSIPPHLIVYIIWVGQSFSINL